MQRRHCRLSPTVVWVLILAGLSWAPLAALEPVKTPVTVTVTPSTLIAGATVTIEGTSVPLGDQSTVEIRVRPPQGAVESLQVKLDDAHAFALTWEATSAEGRYTVVALSPDGKNSARVEFEVVKPAVLRDKEMSRLKTDLDAFSAKAASFESTLTQAPASVARDELIERTAETGRLMATASQSVDDLGRALAALDQAASSGGDSTELSSQLSELYGELSDAADTVAQRRIDFERQMARFDYDHTLCDGLHYVREAWSTMTAALSAAKNLAKSVAEVARDQLIDAGVKAAGDATKRPDDSPLDDLTRDQALSMAKDLGTDSFNALNSSASALQGLVGAGLAEVFALACVEYVGNYQAWMGADILEGGQIYWQHQTWLKGKIRVRHEAPAGGGVTAAIPVTGEIEGVANKFEVEEALYVLQPGIEKDVLLRWAIPPVGGLFLEDAGFFRPLTPYSFYIPLRGVLEGNQLKLRIEEATRDYEASTTAVYILVNPAVPFPHVMTQELPYQDGGFIVSRAFDGDPEFEVVVHRDQGYSEIHRNFKRNATTPGGGAEVKWTAEVHACSPRCP